MKNKKIKIVHIIPTLSFGGAERFLVDLINNGDKDKFEHSVIIFKEVNGLADQLKSSCQVVLVAKKGKVSLSLFSKIKQELKKIRPDIVHTHLFGANFWGRVAAHSLNIPVVTTEHGVNLDESYWRTLVLRILKNYTNLYISPSQFTAEYMKKTYDIKKEIKILPHGIEVDKFSKAKQLEKSEKFKLLILGRLDLTKGQDIALKALAKLKNYNWELEIVGEGADKNKIVKLISDLNLQDRVRVLPAIKNVAEVLERNQIVLIPSRLEAFGLTAAEAMATGRIVISSNAGGLPEVVKDGKTGLVFEVGDVKDLVGKLKNVFDNFEKFLQVVKKGRELAKKDFSIERMVGKYEDIYQSLRGM